MALNPSARCISVLPRTRRQAITPIVSLLLVGITFFSKLSIANEFPEANTPRFEKPPLGETRLGLQEDTDVDSLIEESYDWIYTPFERRPYTFSELMEFFSEPVVLSCATTGVPGRMYFIGMTHQPSTTGIGPGSIRINVNFDRKRVEAELHTSNGDSSRQFRVLRWSERQLYWNNSSGRQHHNGKVYDWYPMQFEFGHGPNDTELFSRTRVILFAPHPKDPDAPVILFQCFMNRSEL